MFLLGEHERLSRDDALAGAPFTLVTSASDLKAASECEWGFLRALDGKLGRAELVEEPDDPMNRRAAGLGDRHEERRLELYRDEHPGRVVEIRRPADYTRAGLRAAADETVKAFAGGADVVFQATFFDESILDAAAAAERASSGLTAITEATARADIAFLGFADFIVRTPDGRYRVQDTKLARRARVTALLQLAAYAEQLEKLGIPVDDEAELLLGDGTESRHRLTDIVPVFRNRRARLHHVLAEHLSESDAVAWGDGRYDVCGRCEHCEPAVEASRDVLLVAGMRLSQRERLRDAGIHTIDELAASTGKIDTVAETTLDGLREQASLQLEALASPEPAPPYVVHDPAALGVLPPPDAGDIFFDFEGDPLYMEGRPVPGQATRWGIDYLFGLVDNDETFTTFWAHDYHEERQALLDFLAFVKLRRAAHPGMHIYHYASYERTHLTTLAARYGVGEDDVDTLLREGVLVDLYPLVRKSVRVGSRSYSIKKLEPLYMGEEHRDDEGVTNAGDSIVEYVNACELRDNGDIAGWQAKLDEIGAYNKYDCVSTLRLRDWLIGHAQDARVPIGQETPEPRDADVEASPLRLQLLALAGDTLGDDRDPEQRALALAAAAIDYHARENKIFWWGHFSRLISPLWEWENTRDVFVVESGEVVENWAPGPRGGAPKRLLRLTGRFAPGSSLGKDAQPFAVYEHPGPFRLRTANQGARPWSNSVIEEVDETGCLLVRETKPVDAADYDDLPLALTPASPPHAGALVTAIHEWGESLTKRHPEWPKQSAVDVLRREPPRLRHHDLATLVQSADPDDRVSSVIAAVLDLDHSYLAVQGPPGTGKTYLGAHVIARLVAEHGWKIGVVGQSHKVVENLLGAIVGAGLDGSRVGKAPKRGEAPADAAFTVLSNGGERGFAGAQSHGYVLGGTAWTFANPNKIDREELDLIVIDEAGQFSLAATIAVSVAARNLLLLGDPQQLPQVSQAVHPEPIQTSALGWVTDGHDVLPPGYGFFLAESRRMHPTVTAPVSRLSYEAQLRSHPCAAERRLDGVEPGVHPVPVAHEGDSVDSVAEATEVVRIVRGVLGKPWTDPHAKPPREADPLAQCDIIVVTPYNAQLALVRGELDAAGYTDVPVGTVDKFQGQEAAIAIVTLAASSAHDVPRGMEFLIMKNRLNVAISRAQWAAYLVHSPALIEHLPITPEGVARLSAFIDLVTQNQILSHGVTGERNATSSAAAEPGRSSLILPARASVTAETPPR